ncbi:hypothetical protein HANVADRAFT_27957, partial [Hanseniaspora valbyensis NRRL Y-1626]
MRNKFILTFIPLFFLSLISNISNHSKHPNALFSEAVGTADEGYVNGCNIYGASPSSGSGSFVSGWEGNIYYYPWASYNSATGKVVTNKTLYLTEYYLNGGYAGTNAWYSSSYTPDKTKPGIIANYVTANILSFSYSTSTSQYEVWGTLSNVYQSGAPVTVSVTNFAMFLNAYLVPTTTGVYSFNLGYIDDLAIVNLGDGVSQIACCSIAQLDTAQAIPHTQSQIESIWTAYGPSGTNTFTVTLTAGYMYPISFFYVNRAGEGGYDFTYTDPSGVTHSDWSSLAYQ